MRFYCSNIEEGMYLILYFFSTSLHCSFKIAFASLHFSLVAFRCSISTQCFWCGARRSWKCMTILLFYRFSLFAFYGFHFYDITHRSRLPLKSRHQQNSERIESSHSRRILHTSHHSCWYISFSDFLWFEELTIPNSRVELDSAMKTCQTHNCMKSKNWTLFTHISVNIRKLCRGEN